uniref:Wsv267-like protein n=1 Tax=Metapenaeus joyneri majanivirus TaxID=2984280 RepID=A0A9C7BN62_9VIRU|nr:MAG: wsv267-like protein [Metapenaeus joyneri majanivirus]
MSCVENLISLIHEHNYVILQTYCLNGSTRLTKIKSLNSALKCYTALENMSINLPSHTPYSMIIVIKLSNFELDAFFKTYSYTDVLARGLKTRKINYTANINLSSLLNDIEIWLDEKMKNHCPSCNVRNKITTYAKSIDTNIILSYPIMIEPIGIKHKTPKIVNFRLIQMAGYMNNLKEKISEGIICFPMLNSVSLEWSSNNNTTNINTTSINITTNDKKKNNNNKNKNNNNKNKNNNNNNDNNNDNNDNNNDNNNNNYKSNDKKSTNNIPNLKKKSSKMCCLIYYMWSKEIAREIYKTDSFLVRLLSINPSKINNANSDITNEQYFNIKESYEKNICNDYFSTVIYPQECNEKIKIITML